MQYYRCKCGYKTAWGSMPCSDCQGCDKCNTTLETHPDMHQELKPHDFIEKFDENTGKPYKRCRICMYSDKEIEREKKAYEE